MDIEDLLTSTADLPLSEAAERFAASGVPVFPCVPGRKWPLVEHRRWPLTEHGVLDATTDARTVSAWWRRWPTANLGIPTGAVSGVEVVDVDRKTTGSGFESFDRARETGLIPAWAALVRTPSGGLHAYFPADPSYPQQSWQAARAHVDFRGRGGYVLVPPSVVIQPDGHGRRYEVIAGAQAAPAWVDAGKLREFLDPPRPTLYRPGSDTPRSANVARLAGWVAALGEGERNRGLFWAACRLAEAGTAPSATLDALAPAAEHAGLPPREVLATVRSAYRTVGPAPSPFIADGLEHGGSRHGVRPVDGQVLS